MPAFGYVFLAVLYGLIILMAVSLCLSAHTGDEQAERIMRDEQDRAA